MSWDAHNGPSACCPFYSLFVFLTLFLTLPLSPTLGPTVLLRRRSVLLIVLLYDSLTRLVLVILAV